MSMIKAAHAAIDVGVATGTGLTGVAYFAQWIQGAEALVALGFAVVIGYVRVRIVLREWSKIKEER